MTSQAFNLGRRHETTSCEWYTPWSFIRQLEAEFGKFTLDVCATEESAKAPEYFTIEDDGLSQTWHGNVWMNPPYGRELPKWLRKAAYEAEQGNCTVVCLVPATMETKWFREATSKASVVRFVAGRIKFIMPGAIEGKNGPYGLAVLAFGDVKYESSNIVWMDQCSL